jgi:hypothetical protein
MASKTVYSHDLDRKQGLINFSKSGVSNTEMGMGDFKFTSLTKGQLSPSEPTQDEGRLYIKDQAGILYYITATRVG